MNPTTLSAGLPFKMVSPKSLERHPRADFLGISEKLVQAISADMGSNGFEISSPIVAWENEGKLYIADGRTRAQAAIKAGIKEVPVFFASFDSVDSFVEASIMAQTHRRQTKMGDALKIIETLWPIKAAQAKARQEHRELILPGGGAPQEDSQEDSQEEHGSVCDIIGNELGMSGETASRLKKIIDYSKEHETSHRDELASGERKNIREAYEEIVALEKRKTASKTASAKEVAPVRASKDSGTPEGISGTAPLPVLASARQEREEAGTPSEKAAPTSPQASPKAATTVEAESIPIDGLSREAFKAILGLVPLERLEDLSEIVKTLDGEAREAVEGRIGEMEEAR